MKKIIILTLLIQSSVLFAGKKVTVKDLSVLGRIDEKKFKKNDSANSEINFNAKPENVKFKMSCKDSNGKEFVKGDDGYDSCFSGINLKSNKKNETSGNSAGFNYKIGE